MWPFSTLNNHFLLVFTLLVILYLFYRAALPKPIPGIPHSRDAARHIFGDIPAILRTTANSNLTHVQWIQQQLQKLNSPIIQIFLGPFSRPVIVVGDFREAQDVLMRRKEWDRSDVLSDLFWGLIPDHHSQYKTDGVWKARRRLLQDLMSPPFLHNVAAPALYANALTLMSLWVQKAAIAGKRPFSASEDISRAALDAVHAFAFGGEFQHNATRPQREILAKLNAEGISELLGPNATNNCDDPVHFPNAKCADIVDATFVLAEAVETVQGTPSMRLAWKLMQLNSRYRWAKNIRDKCILGELHVAVNHLGLQDRQEQHDTSDPTSRIRSAVDHMIQREEKLAKKEGRQPDYFSPTMMTEIFGFVITGHDTSSTALLWGLKCLSDNQTSQMHLRSNLQSFFVAAKAENRNPSVREIISTNIPYLDATIEEILRYAGTIPCIDRQATADTELLGHFIPKGTTLYILSSGPSVKSPAFEIDENLRSKTCQDAKKAGRHRSGWEPQDVGFFKPERWLVSVDTSPSKSRAEGTTGKAEFNTEAGPQLAFSLGTRSCYGRRLAYLELRIFVVLIVWNFELSPCPAQLSEYGSKIGITNKPRQCFVRPRRTT